MPIPSSNFDQEYSSSQTQGALLPSLKLPYLQATGASRQEVSELSSKVRDLELTILDLRASLDRKVTQLSEELPGRLQREVKNLEGRDSHMWRESLAKQATLMETVTRMRD
jgi:hypothetical protein